MNDRDSDEGAYAYSILDSAVRFTNEWYDMTVDEIKAEIKNGSKNDFVYIKFNYWDLGRDEEWFQEQCRGLNNDLMKIKRELLLEWTIANDRSPFSEEQLNNIQGYVKREPVKYFYVKKIYKFFVYEELTNIFKKNWLISIDIGGGLQQDFTVIAITDPLTKRLKAVYRSNNILGDELVELVHEMVATFFPNAVIIPERNSLGVPIIDRMMKDPVIRPRLYYETKDKVAERVVEDPRKSQHIKTKRTLQVYGQFTSGPIRKVMFDEILPYMVENEPENIIVPELFHELKTLERSKNGKIEAKSGAHDDVLMAWLIGLYALLYGNNIKKFVSLIGDFSEVPNGEFVSPGSKYLKSVNRVQAIRNMPPELRNFVEQSANVWTREPDNSEKSKINRNLKNLLGR